MGKQTFENYYRYLIITIFRHPINKYFKFIVNTELPNKDTLQSPNPNKGWILRWNDSNLYPVY